MNPESLAQEALNLVTAHPYAAGAIVAVVGVLAYFKFKLVLKLITASLILVAIGYVILFIVNLTSTGMENTEKFIGSPNQVIDRMKKE